MVSLYWRSARGRLRASCEHSPFRRLGLSRSPEQLTSTLRPRRMASSNNQHLSMESIIHDLISWPHFMAWFHGFISWLHFMASFHGSIPWLHCRLSFYGFHFISFQGFVSFHGFRVSFHGTNRNKPIKIKMKIRNKIKIMWTKLNPFNALEQILENAIFWIWMKNKLCLLELQKASWTKRTRCLLHKAVWSFLFNDERMCAA